MPINGTTNSILTDEELMALPKDGYKRELLDGEIVMSPAGSEHGRQIMRFSHVLGSYIYPNNLGELYDGQTGFRMASGDLLCPDISFVAASRVPAGALDGFFEGAPDLVIEFLSPSESKGHIERKLALYFANRAQRVWIIDMRKHTVTVYTNTQSFQVLTESDTLLDEELFPGLAISVSSLFTSARR